MHGWPQDLLLLLACPPCPVPSVVPLTSLAWPAVRFGVLFGGPLMLFYLSFKFIRWPGSSAHDTNRTPVTLRAVCIFLTTPLCT